MKKVKAACAAFLISVLMFSLSFSAAAIEIDGDIGKAEWLQSAEYIVIPFDDGAKSNCGITFAFMKAVINEEERRLYLAFKCIDSAFVQGSGVKGTELYVNGEKEKTAAYSDSGKNIYDTASHSLGSAFSENAAQGEFYAEIYMGFKFGLPQRILLGVRIVDCNGEPSNYYEFLICDQAATPAAASALQETEKSTSATSSVTKTETEKLTESTGKPITSKVDITSKTQQFTTVKFVPYIKPTTAAPTTKKNTKLSKKSADSAKKTETTEKETANKTQEEKLTAAQNKSETETAVELLTATVEAMKSGNSAETAEIAVAESNGSTRKLAAVAAVSSLVTVGAVGAAKALVSWIKGRVEE